MESRSSPAFHWYNGLFVFGDSFADIGNFPKSNMSEVASPHASVSGHPGPGIHRPTRRGPPWPRCPQIYAKVTPTPAYPQPLQICSLCRHPTPLPCCFVDRDNTALRPQICIPPPCHVPSRSRPWSVVPLPGSALGVTRWRRRRRSLLLQGSTPMRPPSSRAPLRWARDPSASSMVALRRPRLTSGNGFPSLTRRPLLVRSPTPRRWRAGEGRGG